jgi:hypothetical protein
VGLAVQDPHSAGSGRKTNLADRSTSPLFHVLVEPKQRRVGQDRLFVVPTVAEPQKPGTRAVVVPGAGVVIEEIGVGCMAGLADEFSPSTSEILACALPPND